MVPTKQDFLALQLGDQGEQRFILSAHGHITEDIDCIPIIDFGVPMLENVLVHLIHRGEWAPIVVPAFICLVAVEQVQISNVIVHPIPPQVIR